MKKSMSFREVLDSEYKGLVEAIEHGSSDKSLIDGYKKTLLEKTGFKWFE